MKVIINSLLLVCAGYVGWGAVRDFDAAKTWLDFAKALFWIIVSISAFWNAIQSLLDDEYFWEKMLNR